MVSSCFADISGDTVTTGLGSHTAPSEQGLLRLTQPPEPPSAAAAEKVKCFVRIVSHRYRCFMAVFLLLVRLFRFLLGIPLSPDGQRTLPTPVRERCIRLRIWRTSGVTRPVRGRRGSTRSLVLRIPGRCPGEFSYRNRRICQPGLRVPGQQFFQREC